MTLDFSDDDAALRDPTQVIPLWGAAGDVDPARLRTRVHGDWWDLLEELGIVLLVTREYEHLVIAINGRSGGSRLSYLPLPHPSGLVVERGADLNVRVAATRNPNQIFKLRPSSGGAGPTKFEDVLLPHSCVFLPGSLYLHDLAIVGGDLYGNAVGRNSIVSIDADGGWQDRWWPGSIEEGGSPRFDKNFLQLNSIAAGDDLNGSFFSASTDRIGRRRPGHLNFDVDRRGVIFSGRTREPVARGLTRPHSARLHQGKVWVANSGYGEVGFIEDGGLTVVSTLQGWTRGLCFVGDVCFVGLSRVLPRFSHYAPGVAKAACGIQALDTRTGALLGRITWPAGNQIFAIDWCPGDRVSRLPHLPGNAQSRTAAARHLYSSFGSHDRGDRG